ncbi:hypothetical protein OIO90_004004 [Microbotryomycetes sp. JL221]|nr:hypothetical protein OIO90_004004 [Microbotryomycetes sp. JL221]
MSSNLNKQLEQFLSNAVNNEKLAPCLSAVAFNQKQGNVAEAAIGIVDLDSNKPLKLDTTVWFASTGKLSISLLSCILAEQHQVNLDSHSDLIKYVPELSKEFPNSRIYEQFKDKDESGVWTSTKDALNDKPTLRHLLTHTFGSGYFFNHEAYAWAWENLPSGSELGSIEHMNIPRLKESGKEWIASGKSVREAFKTYLFEPLGIESDTLDTFRTPVMDDKRGKFAFNTGPGEFIVSPIQFDTPQFEDHGPEGKFPTASAPLWGTVPAYAKVFASILQPEGPKNIKTGQALFSKEFWKDISSDNLKQNYNLSIQQNPFSESVNLNLAKGVDFYNEPKNENDDQTLGWSALQATVSRQESKTGLKVGTLGWCGLANTYFFVDREQGIGGLITTQMFPWAAESCIKVKRDFERWVVDNVSNN